MRAFFVIISLLFLAGCGSKKQVAESALPIAPGWVDNRPLSSTYYIGIGVAQKTAGANFQRTAKENALSDLASEIQVNVNTNSLLYTLEREYKFEQEFRESIRTSSNLNLEGFENVDAWEDQKSYWVYYRINKADYQEKQRQKQNAAQDLAIDFFAKAQSAETSGQFSSAIDYYLRGLQALENFWGENNTVDFQGQTLLLDNALFGGLKSALTEQRLVSENGLTLNYHNGFSSQALLRVTHSKSGAPQEAVPLTYEYFGLYGRVRGKVRTNADGRAEIPIQQTDKERPTNMLVAAVDTELLFEPFQSDPFLRKLTQSLRGQNIQEVIEYRAPSVFLDVSEKNIGKEMSGNQLSAAVMTSLSRRGITFANKASDADLTLTLRADTRQGGESQGFRTGFLQINLEISDNLTGQTVYKVSRDDIKGVDLDYEKAGVKAYQNFTRNIESELMRKLVSDLF